MLQAPEMPEELFESQYKSLQREFDNIRRRFGDERASCR
jgi:molecular chaperone GrpE (heat shock protein)